MRTTRIGRMAFIVALVAAGALFYGAFYGSFELLTPLARMLAPYGINAGTAQNAIIIAAGLAAVVLAWWAAAARLRDLGEPTLWAPLSLLPPALLLLVDGPLFLTPVVDVPGWLEALVWLVCGGIGVATFLHCALIPGVAVRRR